MAERRKASLGSLVAFAIVAVLIVLGGRWYYYVAFAEDPFDEVGIGLNSMMPGPVNAWGCAMLKQRFEKTTIPPMGCGQGVRW